MSDKNPLQDDASLEMLSHMSQCGYESTWDRYQAQVPQCGFGSSGLCCRHCNMGPCNIDPFGNGAQAGVCGAN
ncbi:carbon monoxide dehydrogenase, partial [bacterium]|nr:carbon monoxide dehydrogenase [bacterium]